MEAIWRDYWQIIRRWPLPHRLVAIGDRVAHDRHDFGTQEANKSIDNLEDRENTRGSACQPKGC
ncbi:MAG: hypothetical protein ACLQF1_13075 [Methyloceanibacter sp.]